MITITADYFLIRHGPKVSYATGCSQSYQRFENVHYEEIGREGGGRSYELIIFISKDKNLICNFEREGGRKTEREQKCLCVESFSPVQSSLSRFKKIA